MKIKLFLPFLFMLIVLSGCSSKVKEESVTLTELDPPQGSEFSTPYNNQGLVLNYVTYQKFNKLSAADRLTYVLTYASLTEEFMGENHVSSLKDYVKMDHENNSQVIQSLSSCVYRFTYKNGAMFTIYIDVDVL